MKRKQIYIAPEQEEQLLYLAAERKVPVSHLIREAVAAYIAGQEESQALERAEDHPLWKLIGAADAPQTPSDGSTNHDAVLYGRPKRSSR
jgi:hypothetical protein